MKKVRYLPIFLLIALVGCASAGRRLEPSVVDRIKAGVTTRQEVEHMLGSPDSVVQGPNRRMVADFAYQKLLPGNRSTSSSATTTAGFIWHRRASVLYDEKGIVLKKSHFETERPYHVENGRVWIGQTVSDADVSEIKLGTTTFSELTGRLGKPMSKGLSLEGNFVYDWFYGSVRDTSLLNMKKQTFQIVFGSDGKVLDYRIIGKMAAPKE